MDNTAEDNTPDTPIGTGRKNTQLILIQDTAATVANNAAKACYEYSNNGKTDWYLPSKNELNELYQRRSLFSITTGIFWSSSQYEDSFAWNQNFDSSDPDCYGKNGTFIVRAIRAF